MNIPVGSESLSNNIQDVKLSYRSYFTANLPKLWQNGTLSLFSISSGSSLFWNIKLLCASFTFPRFILGIDLLPEVNELMMFESLFK